MKPLSKLQADTLQFIKDHIRSFNCPPTMAGLAHHYGRKRSTMYLRLTDMVERGALTNRDGKFFPTGYKIVRK